MRESILDRFNYEQIAFIVFQLYYIKTSRKRRNNKGGNQIK